MFRLLLMIWVVLVNGHSLLRTPTAWKTSESKRAPCGGVTVTASLGKATTVEPSKIIDARWDVTAGDGNGPITVTYVTTDAEATTAGFNAAFANSQTLTVNMDPIPQRGTGQYPFKLTTPASGICKGGVDGKSCHIQVKSTSNWYSCATLAMNEVVAITTAPTAGQTAAPTTLAPTGSPTAPQPRCTTLTGTTGTMCQALEGKPAFPINDLPGLLISLTSEFQDARYNPIVFRNPEPTLCGQYLAQFFCSLGIQTCSTTFTLEKVCKTRCQAAMFECDVDPFHEQALLEAYCDADEFSETNSDAYGSCPIIGQRVIYLKNLLIGNEPNFWASGVKYLSKKIWKGDKLTWKWKAPSTLFKFPNENAFKTCDFSLATQLVGTQDGEFMTYSLDPSASTMEGASDEFWYGSNGNGGCISDIAIANNGFSQKMSVKVLEVPAQARIIAFDDDVEPVEISTNPPTQGPPGFLGNPILEDSASLARMQIALVTIICTFFMILL